jgi:transcription elongation GreA/GreB family factor
MRPAILLLSVALCGCGADDQMRVLDTTPEGIEAWAWTQAYSKQAMTEMAQQYCQRDGRNAQIIDSEVAEKHVFKGSRVVYRFKCVR